MPLASLAGALGAVLIVYALAQVRHRGFSTDVLLLAGVTLNAFFSALILLVQYLSDFTETMRTLRWLMGDLDVAGYRPLADRRRDAAAGHRRPSRGCRAASTRSRSGAEQAGTRGVPVLGVQRLAFFAASLGTGVAVSLAGPIGFVGIIVPHLVRLLVGADHRVVLPASALFGAAFLMACDAVARVVLSPVELPVGVVTAVLGAPFFLWLLIRKHEAGSPAGRLGATSRESGAGFRCPASSRRASIAKGLLRRRCCPLARAHWRVPGA